MSHYTLFINDILNKNYLFQEEEKKVNSSIPTLSSNSYSFVYHKLTAYVYAKYKEKYNLRGRSFYIK